jgi:hypothetical protein
MGFIGSLVRTFVRLTILGAIASAIGAAIARNHMVSRGQPEDDEFDLVAIMSPLDFTSTAKAFRRGSYLAWYGGGSLDLRGASLDPAGATLTVRAIFGGFRLVVPASWRVENRMLGIFGGSGDGRPASMIATDGPVLVLEGWAFFGGVGVVSEAPDLDASPVATASA